MNNMRFCPGCRYQRHECECHLPDPLVEQLRAQSEQWQRDIGITEHDREKLAQQIREQINAGE